MVFPKTTNDLLEDSEALIEAQYAIKVYLWMRYSSYLIQKLVHQHNQQRAKQYDRDKEIWH